MTPEKWKSCEYPPFSEDMVSPVLVTDHPQLVKIRVEDVQSSEKKQTLLSEEVRE